MLSDYDHVCADYNFRWFTEEEIYNFLQNALRQLNVAPPFRSWTLRDLTFNSQASQYAAGVIYGAARDALRTMMMCLQFQEPQEVFGGADAAKDAFGNMNTLKENYEKSFDQIIENKKYGKYPRTRTMTVPSYTLPGGRSRWFRYLFSGST